MAKVINRSTIKNYLMIGSSRMTGSKRPSRVGRLLLAFNAQLGFALVFSVCVISLNASVSYAESRESQASAMAKKAVPPIKRAGLDTSKSNRSKSLRIATDVGDSATINAFRMYWNSFDKYEKKILEDGKSNYNTALSNLKRAYLTEESNISRKQLEQLRISAKSYRKQMASHGNAENRPYVMLNLAQVMNQIGIHQFNNKNATSADISKTEALAVLADLDSQFPRFSKREAALYLRAIILESQDEDGNSLAMWKLLASEAKNSIYGVHALVAVGDHYFKVERSDRALGFFKRALILLDKIPTAKRAYETLRIQYRIAWSAYRAAELDTVIAVGTKLLTPGKQLRNVEQREMIQKDAAELIGDALYEKNNFNIIKKSLRQRKLLAFGAQIGLRILVRYSSSEIFGEASRVGEFVADEFSLSLEAPTILEQLAIVYQKIRKPRKRVAALEKLALLLPSNSLWRSRHKEEYEKVRMMEKSGTIAAKLVAAWHYDRGLASGNQKSFEASESFYSILVAHDPTGSEASKWRLRQAHGNYFSDRLDQAAKIYSSLKEDFKVTPAILQIAGYQLVLTHEKIWRREFSDSYERGTDPKTDEAALAALKELERVIDEFSNRFPDQERSVDVMLVGASAYRDQGVYEKAARLWQRVLVSKPNVSQRSLAIRGLIFASMKDGSTKEVITASRRFLKLEDWGKLGKYLNKELEGVLSIAAVDEGKRLNQDGKLGEAGMLLVGIAEDFPRIPDRARIYRDGAYMLAISGNWTGASKAATKFLAGKEKNLRGDMIYLLARADEYQIRFATAAAAYLRLGSKYPKHSRSKTSLMRAEKLSIAEDRYDDAGRAAELLASIEKNHRKKLAHFKRSAEHYGEAESFAKAEAVSGRRFAASRTRSEKLESRLLIANAAFSAGSETAALRAYSRVAKEANGRKSQLGNRKWSSLVGESHFKLGEESRAKFEDFDIWERGGSIESNVKRKAQYFSELSTAYEKAGRTNHPVWGAQSRYHLGTSAGVFADEIAGISSRSAKSLTVKTQRRYGAQVKRLREISRKFHNQNVLAKSRNPSLYFRNEWVKKSAIKLSGYDLTKDRDTLNEQLPASVHLDLPNQWSL